MDKNEELQKWLNDDRYVQIEDLATLWNLSVSSIRGRIRKHKIKSTKRISLGQNGHHAFYDKHDCEMLLSAMEQKKQEIEDWSRDTRLLDLSNIARAWNMSNKAACAFLGRKGIKPIKKANLGKCKGCCAYYDRAECEAARPFINQPEQKEVEKVEEKQMELLKNKTIECSNLAARFCGDIAIGRFVMVANELDAKIINEVAGDIICPVLSTQTPQETHDVIKNLIDNNATLLTLGDTDGRLMSIAEAADKGSDIRAIIKFGLTMRDESMPKPKEQTPDIIPADTIDLFTMSELESEFKKRGIELTADVRAKINASDMPEMQHIAKMLRGNAKTITIRLSVLNEIAGQLKSTKKLSFYEKVQALCAKKEPPAPILSEPKNECTINLVALSKKQALDFIRKRLQFKERIYLRNVTGNHDMMKEHRRFDMSGYDDSKCGDCTLHNMAILNEFADLGIYDYTDYLFLDFYKGQPTLYMRYFKDDKHLEFNLCGWTTSEIIYFIFQKTILSGKNKRRRD